MTSGLGSGAPQEPVFETAKLVVPPRVDDIVWQDFFGRAVSATEDRAWVGEPNDNVVAVNEGCVFGFQRGPKGWSLDTHLVARVPQPSASYGRGLAFRDLWGVVGAFSDDTIDEGAGALHLVERQGSEWREQDKAFAPGAEWGDLLGWRVVIDGDRVLAAAPGDDDSGENNGAAYIFRRTPGSLRFEAKLVPVHGEPPSWAVAGRALAFDGRTAVLGATGTYGVAFVFEETPSGWVQTAILEDPLPSKDDDFGWSVAVEDDVIAVGEPVTINLDTFRTGAVFMYERTGPPPGNWTLVQKLKASNASFNPFGGDEFGYGVDLHEGRLLVGAPHGELNDVIAGTAHLFERHGGSWVETRLMTRTAQTNTAFGRAVSLSASFALVGAHVDEGSVPGIHSGAAYVFELPFGEPVCDAVPHSSGAPATLHATGSLAATARALELHAADLPAEESAMFLVSRTFGPVITPPGSQGELCLGGAVGRFTDSVGSTGSTGELHHVVDTDDLPFAPGTEILPGETWYFQTWFRDHVPAPTSNFSEAISIEFR